MASSHSRSRIVPTASLVLGALAGIATATGAGSALALRHDPTTAPSTLEVSHVPPLLTAGGERIDLAYDVYCVGPDDPELACDARGTVFVRPGEAGEFRPIALRPASGSSESTHIAPLPTAVAESPSGFSYYAELTSERLGSSVVLPAGGASAPQRSLPLGQAIAVALGAHRFGGTRAPDERVAAASWGAGVGEVGLEQGPNLTPIGGSSFDVGRDGTVHVLDEANRRLLRFPPGARVPGHVPLRLDGTIADLALGSDGTAFVLETASAARERPVLRAFARDGSERGEAEVAERAAQVRMGPDGTPFVLQHPSGQWMPGLRRGRLLEAREQQAAGRPGRPLPGGGEVLVLRHGNELRLALAGPRGTRQSWRVTSETPLAEVQVAEAVARRLVVVVRVHTDVEDEFLVLVLGEHGIVSELSIEPADWAEIAPLSRFRLAGTSLYRLGSTAAGLFVDRFDLEVE